MRTVEQMKRIAIANRKGGVSRYLGHSDVAITLRVYDHNTLSPADVLGPEAVA